MFRSYKWVLVITAIFALTSCRHMIDQLPNTPTPNIDNNPPCKTCGSTVIILGLKGEKGDTGRDGINGEDGAPGEPGKNGENGKNGNNGKNGAPGRSPKNVEIGPTANTQTSNIVFNAGATGQTASGASSIVKGLIATLALWIMRSLASYTLQRMHLARSLYIDMSYRVGTSLMVAKKILEWQLKLAETPKEIPPLTLDAEDHSYWKSLHGDMKACLWGQEMNAVAAFYRNFDEIEIRAARIAAIYEKMQENDGATQDFDAQGSYEKRIAYEFAHYEDICSTWVSVCTLKVKNSWKNVFSRKMIPVQYSPSDIECIKDIIENADFESVARKSLFPSWKWYTAFVGAPAATIAIIPILFFFELQSDETYDIERLAWAQFVSLLVCWVGGYLLLKWGNSVIKRDVFRRL